MYVNDLDALKTLVSIRSSAKQGGIDGGGHENPMSAAVRELKEETGISSARIVAIVSFLPCQCLLLRLKHRMQKYMSSFITSLLRNSDCVTQLDDWLDYDFPTDIKSGMTGSWLRYRGQTQKWRATRHVASGSLGVMISKNKCCRA